MVLADPTEVVRVFLPVELTHDFDCTTDHDQLILTSLIAERRSLYQGPVCQCQHTRTTESLARD
jgi:hypothetical protein